MSDMMTSPVTYEQDASDPVSATVLIDGEEVGTILDLEAAHPGAGVEVEIWTGCFGPDPVRRFGSMTAACDWLEGLARLVMDKEDH